MRKQIITIGRQYGSGGREIGERLADLLGIACYDTILLEKAAENSGLSGKVIERYDEQLKDKWLHTSGAEWSGDPNRIPIPIRAALSQFEIIERIGKNESAVIIGRCADHVLREQENVLSVFIHAGIDRRIERVAKRNSISETEARKLIRNTDKHRAAYYEMYTDKKWGIPESYNICIDSGVFGIDGSAELLKESARISQAGMRL